MLQAENGPCHALLALMLTLRLAGMSETFFLSAPLYFLLKNLNSFFLLLGTGRAHLYSDTDAHSLFSSHFLYLLLLVFCMIMLRILIWTLYYLFSLVACQHFLF